MENVLSLQSFSGRWGLVWDVLGTPSNAEDTFKFVRALLEGSICWLLAALDSPQAGEERQGWGQLFPCRV